ncbi:hypothetical protein [uncultured Brevundimonas sp.]|uniref:hypothetical protein n=1 Tax=uncultured Brevundimonas sp. TaxID=213418 RepID=UPI0030EE0221|tara:strand:+ start:48862 stop:49173 length:312 start_codon:yes stop_codon:yes gene_type:complete
MNFKMASKLWLELADVAEPGSEDRDDDFIFAERVILAHPPRDDMEAVLIAEVLAESIAGGERSDGLDVAAVRNLQSWVGRSLTGAVSPTAFRALARCPTHAAM